MADSKILTLAIIGGAGYLAYRMGWLSSFGLAPPADTSASTASTSAAPVGSAATAPAQVSVSSSPPATVPASAPASPAPAPAGVSLSSVYASLKVAEANSFGGDPALTGDKSNPTASYDVHNWYLTNRAVGGTPANVLPGSQAQISLSDYWTVTAPQVGKLLGLSGAPEGLAALAIAQRLGRRGGW